MSTRLGIDLTASRCALVAAAAGADGVRVRSFRTIASSSGDRGELKAALKTMAAQGTSAHAVLWGVRNLWLSLPVLIGETDLQARAIEAAHAFSPDFRNWSGDAWVHLSITRDRPHGRREAIFVAASGSDIRKRLRTIERAGVAVEGVSMPATALATLARLRHNDRPGTVTAYLALNRESGCIAVVAGGRLVASRDLTWKPGVEGPEVPRQLLERYVLVSRLAPELRHIFDAVRRTSGLQVNQIVTCGDLTELRSLTMPLIEELDIEVETLDSMEGIDVRALPEPRDQFREQIAGLRLAWAVAAAIPAIELAPVARRFRQEPRLPWLAKSAAAAVALVIAALVWPGADRTQATPNPSAPSAQRQRDPLRAAAASSNAPTGSLIALTSAAGLQEPSRARPEGGSTPEVLEPVVKSIVYAADRRLAVVNGQVVRIGDELSGSVVIDITRDAVLMRTAAGLERRYVLRGASGSQ